MIRRGLALVLLPACSWAFVDGPPARPAASPSLIALYDDPPCTRSRVAPALDAYLSLPWAVGAVAMLSPETTCEGTCSWVREHQPVPMPIFLGALAATGFASAWYGFSQTRACRDWIDAALLSALRAEGANP